MNLKKIIAFGLVILGLSVNAQAEKTIRIATEGAYAPFNMTASNGELTGFDIDIAKALCKQMKAKCKIVAQDWDGIIPGLMSRKYDAIIASMSITPERLKVVDFSERYYSNLLGFIAAKNVALTTTKSKLKGKVIGAQRATISAQYLEDNFKGDVTIKLYDTQSNAYLDLKAGRLDAILSDKFPAYDWLKSNEGKGFEFKGNDIDINDRIGIAIRKGDALKGKFSEAIKAIRANGEYQKINAKYFPFDIY